MRNAGSCHTFFILHLRLLLTPSSPLRPPSPSLCLPVSLSPCFPVSLSPCLPLFLPDVPGAHQRVLQDGQLILIFADVVKQAIDQSRRDLAAGDEDRAGDG